MATVYASQLSTPANNNNNDNDNRPGSLNWNSLPRRSNSTSLEQIRHNLAASRYSPTVVERIQTRQRQSLDDRIRSMRLSLTEQPKYNDDYDDIDDKNCSNDNQDCYNNSNDDKKDHGKEGNNEIGKNGPSTGNTSIADDNNNTGSNGYIRKRREKFRLPTLAISKGTPLLSAYASDERLHVVQRRGEATPSKARPYSLLVACPEVWNDHVIDFSRSSSSSSSTAVVDEPAMEPEVRGKDANDGGFVKCRPDEDLMFDEKREKTKELKNEEQEAEGRGQGEQQQDNEEEFSTRSVFTPEQEEVKCFTSSFTFTPSKEQVVDHSKAGSVSSISHLKFHSKEEEEEEEEKRRTNVEPQVVPSTHRLTSPEDGKTQTFSRNCYQVYLSDKIQTPSHRPEPATSGETLEKAGSQVVKEVVIDKGPFSLGFCIEGGKGSPLGDRPIIVKRLFKGDTSVKGILEPGDVIVSVNGIEMAGKTHYQAWNLLKSQEGKMAMKIARGQAQ